MLKILWKRREIAPEEHFLLLSTIFSYLMLDFYVRTWIRFSLRDKRLFKITDVELTRVDCDEFNNIRQKHSFLVHLFPKSEYQIKNVLVISKNFIIQNITAYYTFIYLSTNIYVYSCLFGFCTLCVKCKATHKWPLGCQDSSLKLENCVCKTQVMPRDIRQSPRPCSSHVHV